MKEICHEADLRLYIGSLVELKPIAFLENLIRYGFRTDACQKFLTEEEKKEAERLSTLSKEEMLRKAFSNTPRKENG